MHLKLLAAVVIAAGSLTACYSTPPVIVNPPPPPMASMPAPMPEPMPMPMPAPDTMSLHDRVHAALMDGMGAAANGIEVRVEGSAVYLSGHVATKADHDRAHEIAHGVSGVTNVNHDGLKFP